MHIRNAFFGIRPNTNGRRRAFSCISLLLLGSSIAALAASPVLAGDTWSGTSSASWNNSGNWSSGVPANGADVTIAQVATGSFAPSNFNYNVTLNSLTLDATTNTTTNANGYVIDNAGSFTLGLESGGAITDNATNVVSDQINTGITLNGPATITVSSGATGLSIGGAGIVGTGGLTVSNSGKNPLLFTANNTYTGGTTISTGTLQLGQGGSTGSIVGDVDDKGTLAFDRDNNVTFSGDITGSGAVTQMGSATLTLTGTNNYSGGTTISSGTLIVGDGTTHGSITGNVTDDGSLEFNRSDNIGFSGDITGSGSVTQLGSGKLTLSGTNTYSGGTNIAAGTLSVSGSGNLGTGTISFTNTTANGTTLQITGAGSFDQVVSVGTSGGTIDTDGHTVTLGGGIIGTGLLKLDDSVGTGTLILTGTNTYSGGTTITAGTLQIGSDTVQGSISATGNIADNTVLDFHNFNSGFQYAGTISGSGSVSIDTGLLVFTGNNTYSGGTTVASNAVLQIGALAPASINFAGNIADNGTLDLANVTGGSATISGSLTGTGTLEIGTMAPAAVTLTGTANTFDGLIVVGSATVAGSSLQIGASGMPSQIDGNFSNQGSIDFKNIGTSATISGYILGSGSVELDGGTLILAGSSTNIGGTTTINGSSTLQLGNGGTAGAISGNITGDGTGTLTVDGSNMVTLGGNISNLAALNQNGTGTTVLTGADTYTGTTTINAGTLQIGNGGGTGSIASDVVDNGTLVFDRSGSVTYGGVISQTGGLTQNGGGTLILTNTNTYTGATTINAGTLQIGNGGNSGAISDMSAVTDDGILAFDRSDNFTYGGSVSGSGVLTQMGTHTLTLSGTNTYSGGTNIASGTLAVTSHTNLGSGSINFTNTTANGATLQFLGNDTYSQGITIAAGGATFDTDGNTVELSGGLTGTGALTLNDSAATSGTLILTGGSNYSGGTTITSGTLQLGDGASVGTITGNVLDNGNLAFNEAGNATFSGAISGSGTVTQDDTSGGTLVLSNTSNSYTGNTIVKSGALSISADSDLGTGGTLVLDDGATLDTTATGTYTHPMTVSGNTTLNVASGTTATWSGLIGDGASSGTVNITGGGTFAPTDASNSYSGGTTVNQGSTLVIGADGDIGTGSLTLGDASSTGTLDANASFTTGRIITIEQGGGVIVSESGVSLKVTHGIGGTGGLTASGPGTLILTGASTYAGGTTVSSGSTLQLGDGTNPGTVTGGIADNGALVFNEAGNQTIANVISGTGSLAQSDTTGGTLTLTAANSYTGGTTITSGTLQLGNGTTAGTIIGNVADGGTLAFNEPGDTSFSGIVSGAGGLTQAGTGTLTLTGANTYTGTTTINSGGTLQLGNGGSTGSISAGNPIANNGTLAFDESGTLLFANAISGNGNIAQNGGGTTVLTGANSYKGTTTISAGVLQIGNGGNAGSLPGNVTNNATLAFDRNDVVTYAGVISGTGGLNQMGSGTLILTSANTYSGTTTITSGILQLGNGTTAGTIIGNVSDNGTLVFNEPGDTSFGGVVSGTGGLTQAGTGTLTLTGANTYTGTTTISSGTLQIGNGGTSGAVGGSVVNDGSLAFDRSDTVTYEGVISGTGGLNQTGSGTLILTNANTYSGGTTVSAGTLQIGSGGTSGSIAGDVDDNGALAFDRSDSVTFGGVISGSGDVSQIGSGTTTLTGIETYSGATTVSSGTLLVNGSIVSSSGTTVSSGGQIGGTGSVGKLTVGNNGTVMPGSGGIGTLTVNGTFLLGPGATYAAQVTPTASDLIQVNGTGTLDGALVVTPTGTGFGSTAIPILTTTNGLSGTFSSVTVLGSTTEIPIVSYSADDVFFSFEPTVSSLLPTSSANTNQSRVADAIDFALTHDDATAFNAVTGETGAALTQTLSELSGETAVAFQNVAVSSVASFMNTLFDPSIGGRGGLGGGIDGISDDHSLTKVAYNGANSDVPYQQPSQRAFTIWSDFYGFENTTDADQMLGTHRTDASQYGGTIGLDYRPKRGDGAIGIAFGVTGNNWDLSDQLGRGEATAYQVGGYYSRRFFDTYITAGISYARYSTTTNRIVDLNGDNLYHAGFTANSTATRAEAGHVFHTDIGKITPYARFQADDVDVPRYSETTQSGSPSYALTYTGKQHYDYSSEAGIGWNALIDPLTDIHARAGWLHDYAAGLNDTATFSAFDGASFTVDGASPPRDAGHIVLGISHSTSNVVFTLNGEAAIAGNATSYGGTGSISLRW